MKFIFAVIVAASFSANAYAKENLVCALKEKINPKNYSSVTVNLETKKLEEFYTDEKGINIGKENYSFVLEVERNGKKLAVTSTITENNEVQDEVDQAAFEVTLTKAKAGEPIHQQSLMMNDGKQGLEFVCYYNK